MLKNLPPTAKGIVGLTIEPYNLAEREIGARVLPIDEVAIKASVDSLDALVATLLPTGGGGGGTVPTTLAGLHLNPAVGLDTNDGTASVQVVGTTVGPVKTLGRIVQILGLTPVFAGDFTLFCEGPTGFEAGTLQWTAIAGKIKILGVETVFASPGVVTGVQNRSAATNQRQTVTCGAFNWTTSLGKVVRIVGGPRDGSRATVLTNLGGGAAEVTQWLLTTDADAGSPTITPPINGDTLEVVDGFPLSANLSIAVTGVNNTAAPGAKFLLQRMTMTATNGVQVLATGIRAYVTDTVTSTGLRVAGAQLANVLQTGSAIKWLAGLEPTFMYGGGAFNGNLTVDGGAKVVFSQDTIVKTGSGAGAYVVTGAGSAIDFVAAAAYDWTGFALSIRAGGRADYDFAAALWGTSAVGGSATAEVLGGNTLNKKTSTWVLAAPLAGAAAVPYAVGGATSGMPFDSGATRTYLAATTLTAAKLDAAAGAAGFGGAFVDPISGARLTASA